ncbi:uncharacterized protein [Onthophagus taurus]|uniref:uncharacterized protein n=1 Tax=Onthophagus taurus TaxID=166361 RepID=UPI000C204C10|nr:uncharacterized protein LOC111428862 [Onthophagus taurus]
MNPSVLILLLLLSKCCWSTEEDLSSSLNISETTPQANDSLPENNVTIILERDKKDILKYRFMTTSSTTRRRGKDVLFTRRERTRPTTSTTEQDYETTITEKKNLEIVPRFLVTSEDKKTHKEESLLPYDNEEPLLFKTFRTKTTPSTTTETTTSPQTTDLAREKFLKDNNDSRIKFKVIEITHPPGFSSSDGDSNNLSNMLHVLIIYVLFKKILKQLLALFAIRVFNNNQEVQ